MNDPIMQPPSDPIPPTDQLQPEEEVAVKKVRVVVCGYDGCDEEPAQMWQRRATEEELREFQSDPGIPSVTDQDTFAMVPVYACGQHVPKTEDDEGESVVNLDLLSWPHHARCTLPNHLCICSAPLSGADGYA